MEKIIIKKKYLDCLLKQRENLKLSSSLPMDLDGRLKRCIELREEFSDIIPIPNDIIKNCEEYINNIEDENYKICDKFLIEY